MANMGCEIYVVWVYLCDGVEKRDILHRPIKYINDVQPWLCDIII